ncbi:hypothetical protein JKF63_07464 [Porcisia hertigi]|uniref:Uncharacterized protein n=1 Tax=Porcisia hertigi TaxID=2761500 RepID=A0A836ICY5_9TRYP|nr:hypothetical protein JKF63_07464 [Porcisia hertigi]
MPTSPRLFAPSGFNEGGGGHNGSFRPSRVAAARTIQAWGRRYWEQRHAHRLLLCLHVTKAYRASDYPPSEGSMCQWGYPTAEPTASSGSYPAIRSAPDDESYLARLYETVVKYESALQLENYTRRLLADDFFATSDVAQAASQTTRHMLRQQHSLLRRLSLSVEAMQAAVADGTQALQSPAASTTRVVDKLQVFLTPELFAWWRESQESSTARAQVPATIPQATHVAAMDVGLQPPLPLHVDPNGARIDESPGSESSEAVWMEMDVDEMNDEAAMNAAYATERDAVEKASLLAAQRATMDSRPQGFVVDDGGRPLDAPLESASLTSLPQGDDISLVVQPVLGGVAQRRPDVLHSQLATSSTTANEALDHRLQGRDGESRMCVVCELSGVVANLQSTSDNATETHEEDELHPCSACHALVHRFCACPDGTTNVYYCSSYCYSGGSTA